MDDKFRDIKGFIYINNENCRKDNFDIKLLMYEIKW